MIPELGHFALILSLCVAVFLGIVPLLGAGVTPVANKTILPVKQTAMALAKPAALLMFALLGLSVLCLTISFYTHDFSVQYVAQNSNVDLPWPYRIAAVWGAHEGSLLFWCFVLAGWTAAVALFSRHLPNVLRARVLAVLGWSAVGFISFTVFTSNPFDRTFLNPADFTGFDLNPLLQHPGQAIHPPLLYFGYVGYAVPFAFAMAALMGGKLDALWIRWVRPWALITWMFLTIGITLGSWWAYHELGWGGWWFWDPVENASFMPWLTGTALIHSLAATEKRGVFKSWTVLLSIICFAFGIMGTLLVRSGLIDSVHAFASDPDRGLYLFVFFLLVVIGSLILFAMRAKTVAAHGAYAGWSRELMLLINNVLLTVLAINVVLIGTVGPMFMEAFGEVMSVGEVFYNWGFMAIGLPLLAVMGLGTLTRWKRDDLANLKGKLLLAIPAIILGITVPLLLLHDLTFMAAIGSILAFWVVITCLVDPVKRLLKGRKVPMHVAGMVTAHIGMGVFVLGVVAVNGFSLESHSQQKVGDVVTLGDFSFKLLSIEQQPSDPLQSLGLSEQQTNDLDQAMVAAGLGGTKSLKSNYESSMATIEITRDGRLLGRVYPEKRFYPARASSTSESGVDASLMRDLYVSVDVDPLGEWVMLVRYRPLMRWVWLGALLMALGGLLAALDKRYRLEKREIKQANRDIGAIISDAQTKSNKAH